MLDKACITTKGPTIIFQFVLTENQSKLTIIVTPLEPIKTVPRPNRLETVNLLQNLSSIGRSELDKSSED